MPRLAVYVYLHDDDGNVHGFGPGDRVPSWAVAKITNPDAWAEAPSGQTVASASSPTVPVPSESPAGSEGSGAPDNSAGGDEGGDEGGAGEVSAKPPLTGRGSGLGPWLAYAAEVGVEVPEGAKKDDVVGLVEAAGK